MFFTLAGKNTYDVDNTKDVQSLSEVDVLLYLHWKTAYSIPQSGSYGTDLEESY